MATQPNKMGDTNASTFSDYQHDSWRGQQANVFLEVAIACYTTGDFFGVGVMGTDRNGKALKAWEERNEGFTDPSLIEAVAIRNALLKVRSVGWSKLAVGSSNKRIIHKLQKENTEDVKLATVLEDIIHLSCSFSYFSFVWLPKDFNIKARKLACFASALIGNIDWENVFPNWLDN
ncbi:hypothetical protein ACH5RR_030607 [Cinchona calisaya]|uniref:RNase H type-1 domain-containing protein n=1 Tax=Cinchona calisaya TaxID=153742 RepID=A0ABD2YV33_9GENT